MKCFSLFLAQARRLRQRGRLDTPIGTHFRYK